MPGELRTEPMPIMGNIDPSTMKGWVISSATLPEWVLSSFAERQEKHPEELLG